MLERPSLFPTMKSAVDHLRSELGIYEIFSIRDPAPKLLDVWIIPKKFFVHR